MFYIPYYLGFTRLCNVETIDSKSPRICVMFQKHGHAYSSAEGVSRYRYPGHAQSV